MRLLAGLNGLWIISASELVFQRFQVSRQSKHRLLLLNKKPIIHLKKENPSLFNFVDELRDVRVRVHVLTSCCLSFRVRRLILLLVLYEFKQINQLLSP